MRRKLFIGIGVCLTASCSGWADAPLTWNQCAQEAAQSNADLLAAKQAVENNEAQVQSAWSPFLPTVSGTLSYQHGNASSAAGSVPGSTAGATAGAAFGVITTTNQYSMAFNATQNLFNGFQDKAALDQARANLVASQAALRVQRATLHQSLKKAFMQVVYNQHFRVLAQAIAKRRKDNHDLVALRFEGGRENKGSYLKSKGQWRQADFGVTQVTLNNRVAKQQLAILLGRRDFDEIVVEGQLKTHTLPKDLPDLRDVAKSTPNVQQQAANLKAAEAATLNAVGNLLPALSLTGSISKVGLVFPPDTNRWSVGISLSIPIFRYSNITGISAARASQHKAEYALKSSDRAAATQLSNTLVALRLAAEGVEVQTEVRDAAKVRAEIGRAQYTSGLLSYTDWDLIETDLITQEQNLLSNKQNAVNAEADWENAQGAGDIP